MKSTNLNITQIIMQTPFGNLWIESLIPVDFRFWATL